MVYLVANTCQVCKYFNADVIHLHIFTFFLKLMAYAIASETANMDIAKID